MSKSVNISEKEDPEFIEDLMGKFNSENKRLRFIICTTVLNLVEERDSLKKDKKHLELKIDNMQHKHATELDNIKKEHLNFLDNLKQSLREKDITIDNYKQENKTLLKKIDTMTIDNIKLSSSLKKDKADSRDTAISPVMFGNKSPLKKSPLKINAKSKGSL